MKGKKRRTKIKTVTSLSEIPDGYERAHVLVGKHSGWAYNLYTVKGVIPNCKLGNAVYLDAEITKKHLKELEKKTGDICNGSNIPNQLGPGPELDLLTFSVKIDADELRRALSNKQFRDHIIDYLDRVIEGNQRLEEKMRRIERAVYCLLKSWDEKDFQKNFKDTDDGCLLDLDDDE